MQGIHNSLTGNRFQFVNETDSILSGVDGIIGREYLTHGPESKFENLKFKRDCDDSDEISIAEHLPFKKTKGRVKIKMEYIDNKLRRYTTFSKRKTGIMKKAYELSKLTGTQVMLLVASETGHVYTFATQKLQPMITSEGGKTLIQTCLNTPDGTSPDDYIGSEHDLNDESILNDPTESIVPCDSTSIENSISKDIMNKIFENENKANNYQNSSSIFPSYYQCIDNRPMQLHTTNLLVQQQTLTLQPPETQNKSTSSLNTSTSSSHMMNSKSTCQMSDGDMLGGATQSEVKPCVSHSLHMPPPQLTSAPPNHLEIDNNQLSDDDLLYASLDAEAATLSSQLTSTTHDAEGKPLSLDTTINALNENNEIMKAQLKKLMFNQSMLLKSPSIDDSLRKTTNLKLKHIMKTLDVG